MRKSVGMNNLLTPFVTGGTYLRWEPPIPTLELRLHTYSFERLDARENSRCAGVRIAKTFKKICFNCRRWRIASLLDPRTVDDRWPLPEVRRWRKRALRSRIWSARLELGSDWEISAWKIESCKSGWLVGRPCSLKKKCAVDRFLKASSVFARRAHPRGGAIYPDLSTRTTAATPLGQSVVVKRFSCAVGVPLPALNEQSRCRRFLHAAVMLL